MLQKLIVLLILPTSLLLGGCESAGDVLASAENLRAEVVQKISDVKAGIENVITEAKNTYETLVEKKRELEEMIAQVNAAVDSINKLLGKDGEEDTASLTEEKVELQATIAELQKALDEANGAIEEAQINEIMENS